MREVCRLRTDVRLAQGSRERQLEAVDFFVHPTNARIESLENEHAQSLDIAGEETAEVKQALEDALKRLSLYKSFAGARAVLFERSVMLLSQVVRKEGYSSIEQYLAGHPLSCCAKESDEIKEKAMESLEKDVEMHRDLSVEEVRQHTEKITRANLETVMSALRTGESLTNAVAHTEAFHVPPADAVFDTGSAIQRLLTGVSRHSVPFESAPPAAGHDLSDSAQGVDDARDSLEGSRIPGVPLQGVSDDEARCEVLRPSLARSADQAESTNDAPQTSRFDMGRLLSRSLSRFRSGSKTRCLDEVCSSPPTATRTATLGNALKLFAFPTQPLRRSKRAQTADDCKHKELPPERSFYYRGLSRFLGQTSTKTMPSSDEQDASREGIVGGEPRRVETVDRATSPICFSDAEASGGLLGVVPIATDDDSENDAAAFCSETGSGDALPTHASTSTSSKCSGKPKAMLRPKAAASPRKRPATLFASAPPNTLNLQLDDSQQACLPSPSKARAQAQQHVAACSTRQSVCHTVARTDADPLGGQDRDTELGGIVHVKTGRTFFGSRKTEIVGRVTHLNKIDHSGIAVGARQRP